MPQPDTAISAFAQFGLAGLVILALFYLILNFIDGMKTLSDSFVSQIQKQSELHANERKLWLEVSEKNIDVLRTLSVQLENRK